MRQLEAVELLQWIQEYLEEKPLLLRRSEVDLPDLQPDLVKKPLHSGSELRSERRQRRHRRQKAGLRYVLRLQREGL